ncbi:hypothetical protein RM780_20985 [Streptomyces sp. DSM 44917]|uniref:Integral membrane protein n=2 Tax=Streptomyces boetiae TaxID=3075541 RepID=A0ABU2LCX2_9ACTN|nr:hypothetical protein [Streptomyces sp. DSM 44917]MDT0309415.1 hypothetical protein [Streptomyces sp. DSM 44917]
MLQDVRTTRVTGDATAGIHRRTDDLEDRAWPEAGDPDGAGPAGREPLREAYCWSQLTSGNGTRALWLLLLPFMLANLAHWMRPAAAAPARAHRRYDLLVRLTALSLTVLLAAGACAVSLDLVAWQCAGSSACASGTGWLDPFAPGGGWWAQPGRRLALAALVPAGLLLLLWWLSRRTWSAYESASPPPRPRADAGEDALLSLPGFWYGRGIVARLRSAHTAAGLLTVAAALLAAGWDRDRGPDGSGPLAAAGLLLAVLTGAGLAVLLAQQSQHGRTEEVMDERPEPALSRALPRYAAAVLVAAAVHAAWSRPEWETVGRYPGAQAFFAVLLLVQGALAVAVGLAALGLHRRTPRGERGALAGLGGACVALMACGLGGVLTGGVAQRVADWLDPTSAPGEPGALIAGPPLVLSWVASGIPLLLAVLLGLAAAGLVTARRRGRRLESGVRAAYPGEDCPAEPERSRRIAGAVALAGLTDEAPALIGWISGACLALGLGAVAGAATGDSPSRAAEGAPAPLAAVADACQGLGSWLMGAAVLLLMATGRRAYRDASARRTTGILWDVGTFWPRAAHPFAPPCYAERAVPDLSWRMATWTRVTGGRLVVSAHSQGSVLAAAAVWQLDAEARERIALLTHGSPLARLYGRWFPAFFGPAALRALHRDVPCWRNLWRATDPIGGPASGPGDEGPCVDRGPLADPVAYGRTDRHPLPEPICGHSDYAADPAFAEERTALLRALVPDWPLAVPRQGLPEGRPRPGENPPPGDPAAPGEFPPPGDPAAPGPAVPAG